MLRILVSSCRVRPVLPASPPARLFFTLPWRSARALAAVKDAAEDQIAALFAENARSAKAIGERLSAAANFAYEESQKGGTDMFGETIPQASRTDVLENLHAQS